MNIGKDASYSLTCKSKNKIADRVICVTEERITYYSTELNTSTQVTEERQDFHKHVHRHSPPPPSVYETNASILH